MTNTRAYRYRLSGAGTKPSCGASGIILKNVDGGLNWNSQVSNLSGLLHDVFFTDSLSGYVVGEWGSILKTADGGENWALQLSSSSDFLESVFFVDSNTGYSVGCPGVILNTTNSSINYIEVAISGEPDFILYPNPTNNIINITNNKQLSGEAIISIYNIKGELVKQMKYQNQNTIELYISTLIKCIYLVKIQTKEKIETPKLVIQ